MSALEVGFDLPFTKRTSTLVFTQPAEFNMSDSIFIAHNIVPTVTPLHKDPKTGEVTVDKEGVHKLRIHLQKLGVKGVLILGTTGEFLYMKQALRLISLKALIEEFFGHFVIFGHATGDTKEETFELIKFYENFEKKVDAIAVLPMFYIHDDEEAIKHLKNDFNNIKIPLVLYNNPSITQEKNIPFKIVEEKDLPFVALKDSSGEDDVLRTYLKRFIVYSANENKIITHIQWGARGIVAALGNVFTYPQEIFEVESGEEKQKHQDKVSEVNKIVSTGVVKPYGGFKYSLYVQGVIQYVIAPENKYDILDEQKRALEKLLKQ